MYLYLTIVRYPKNFGWAGFHSMALFHLPLFRRSNISFYKLLGCGKNGTFDVHPDWLQWGLLVVSRQAPNAIDPLFLEQLYGKWITGWWKKFRCEQWTVVLQPTEGHGTWDGKEPFGPLPRQTAYTGPLAVLTRATIRPLKIKRFWQHVGGVAAIMNGLPGFVTSLGIGEVPWIKQATLSFWQSKESMKQFSYKMREHAQVVKKTYAEKWYSEELFVRFKVIGSMGTIRGKNPLEGMM